MLAHKLLNGIRIRVVLVYTLLESAPSILYDAQWPFCPDIIKKLTNIS